MKYAVFKHRYNYLEPYISSKAIEIHVEKHHFSYESKLLKLLEPHEHSQDLNYLIEHLKPKKALQNAKQIYNHNLFWDSLKINQNPETISSLSKIINLEELKENLMKVALDAFGSCWTWLFIENNNLVIANTTNEHIPEGDIIMNLDLWEHAFYVDYSWNRAKYIEQIIKLINFDKIYEKLRSKKSVNIITKEIS